MSSWNVAVVVADVAKAGMGRPTAHLMVRSGCPMRKKCLGVYFRRNPGFRFGRDGNQKRVAALPDSVVNSGS